MTRRVSLLLFLVASCGGSGGGGTPLADQTLQLRVQVLADAVAGQSVPILVSIRRGGAIETDYAGFVTFETASPAAWYPAGHLFTAADRGQRTFPAEFFFPPGVHLLEVEGQGIAAPALVAIDVAQDGAGPGSGVFVPPPVGPPAGPVKYFTRIDPPITGVGGFGTALGDADGDGDLDLVVVGPGYGSANGAELFLNDGSGGFTKAQVLSDIWTYDAAFADVDGDGDQDLALSVFVPGTTYACPHTARIWLNDGSGEYTDSGEDYGTAYNVVFGDLDGDGDEDLVVANEYGSFILRANDGKGKFGSVLASGGADLSVHRPALGDLDGDGDLDMVTGRRIWLNAGDGTMASTGETIGGLKTTALSLVDMDGDGDLDMIVGNYAEDSNLYVNDGSGSFSVSEAWKPGSWPMTAIATLDLDEDGDRDILFATNIAYEKTTLVWLNGDPYVSDGELAEVIVPTTMGFAVGDLEGDGDEDFVGFSSAGLSIYRND